MNFPDDLLGSSWAIMGWIVYLVVMLWAVKTAPWHKVKGDKRAQHVWFGMAFVVVLLWSLSASIGGGFSFHFLLMTTVTLMFGPQFALMTMTLGLLGITLNGEAGWGVFGLNALLMGWIPIMLTWWIYKLAYRYLDRNFFVYVFLNGFLAAGLGALLSMLSAAAIMYWAGAYNYEQLSYNFLMFIPMLVVPEAFLNGFIMTSLVLMKPEWVATFSDADYLKGK